MLITCNHVLNDLKIGNKVKLIFENEKEKIIILDKSRKMYTNQKYDITIIELKEDEFDLNDYLKIDDEIYKLEQFNKKYSSNKSIYIIHYPKGKEVMYSIDIIKNIDKDNYLHHCCTTDNGSSGAPILNLNTFQVIGIHIGYNIELKCNIGKLIKNPIDDFNEKIKKSKNNNNNKKKVGLNKISNINNKNNNEKEEFNQIPNSLFWGEKLPVCFEPPSVFNKKNPILQNLCPQKK